MNQVDWSKLVKPEYWLEGIAGKTSVTPIIARDSMFFWFFLYLFSGFLIIGVAMRISQAFLNSQHPLQKKLPFWGDSFIWMGILGLLWFLVRQLSVGFLGARLWLIVGLIWFIVTIGLIIYYVVTYFPLEIRYYKKNVLQKNAK